jgi:malonate-semialdehyde dehydrogenase (acetylating)/methylmalonate-semialdehyde dehydrogenase
MLIPEVKPHYGRLKFLIGGEWVETQSNQVEPDPNPATGEAIAEFAQATPAEAVQAVESAHQAFQTWKNVPMRGRAYMLFTMHNKFREHSDMLSRVLTQDHVRTIEEARGSVARVLENIESACAAVYGLANENQGMMNLAGGIDEYLFWEPVGAFLIITPGNIPMHAWSSFVPYALAAVSTVVVSPSWHNPVAAETINRMAIEAGFPKGVINMIHGGPEINTQILAHPHIKGVGFIGSTRVGLEIFERCGKLAKSSSINGNGKNLLVIMPDADLDAAVPWMLRACFGMTGQRCLGVDNVVVIGGIYAEVNARFKEAAAKMKLGYGLDTEAEIGPYSARVGRDKVLRWTEKALQDGCKMVLDGRIIKPKDYPNGYFMRPIILEDAHVDMPRQRYLRAFRALAEGGRRRGDRPRLPPDRADERARRGPLRGRPALGRQTQVPPKHAGPLFRGPWSRLGRDLHHQTAGHHRGDRSFHSPARYADPDHRNHRIKRRALRSETRRPTAGSALDRGVPPSACRHPR